MAIKKQEEPNIPNILPASDDGVFKRLMTDPGANDVLRDVISSVIEVPVLTVSVRNNELATTDTQEKHEVFDVNCTTGNNEQVAVEMSANAMEDDTLKSGRKIIRDRSVYEVCDLHSTQTSKGLDYGDLAKSFQITFCDYTVFEGEPDFVQRFMFRTEKNLLLSSAVMIVFIELPKLKVIIKKPVDKMTDLEKWSIFFGYFHKQKYHDVVEKIINSKGEIKMASELLLNISQDERERALYRSRRIAERDNEHNRIALIKQGKKEVARNAIEMGMAVEQIEKLTGLTREEIAKL